MSELLDEGYLTWLYNQVGSVKVKYSRRSYWTLFRQLYIKEFTWFIPNDDNRAADGKDLRTEFLEDSGIAQVEDEWMYLGCSMLEMLVALSRRLSFEDDAEPRVWFWHLIETLEIQYSDREYTDEVRERVDAVLERVIKRTYSPDGSGGLFPLRNPSQDQREVELWYQLNAYLLEVL